MSLLLLEVGAINEDGSRNDGFFIVQLGDLIHGGHDVTAADAETLHLARTYIDLCLIGNHELPFITPLPTAFVGMHRERGRAYHPVAQRALNTAMREGFFHAAAAVDGWLITHAGLVSAYLHDDESANADLRAASELPLPERANAFADALNQHFLNRLSTHERDLVVDGVSPYRGGGAAHGSIFWADLNEVLASAFEFANPVPQIVGHTPRADDRLRLYETPSQPIYSIDLAGIDNGYIGCLSKSASADKWSEHVITRCERPLQARGDLVLDLARVHARKRERATTKSQPPTRSR
jgi:hypothetical protein